MVLFEQFCEQCNKLVEKEICWFIHLSCSGSSTVHKFSYIYLIFILVTKSSNWYDLLDAYPLGQIQGWFVWFGRTP